MNCVHLIIPRYVDQRADSKRLVSHFYQCVEFRFTWDKMIANPKSVDMGQVPKGGEREKQSFFYILAQRPFTICSFFGNKKLVHDFDLTDVEMWLMMV